MALDISNFNKGEGSGVTPADVQAAADAAQSAAEAASIPVADLGAPNGVATLDSTTQVPVAFLSNALSNVPDSSDAVRLEQDLSPSPTRRAR